MTTRACVHCGCADDRACRISVADLAAGVVSDVEFALGRSIAPGETVPCWWTSLNPPVCSAPACQKKAKAKNRGGGRRRRVWWKVVQLSLFGEGPCLSK